MGLKLKFPEWILSINIVNFILINLFNSLRLREVGKSCVITLVRIVGRVDEEMGIYKEDEVEISLEEAPTIYDY